MEKISVYSGVNYNYVEWINKACVAISWAFLIYWMVHLLLSSVLSATPFNGYPADGPFQLFNPLRRIADGQRIGTDFQFYHGFLIPYIHYPIFAIFGKTIFSSEISRFIISTYSFGITSFIFFYLLSGRIKIAVVLTSIFIILGHFTWLYALLFPWNSLLGLRSCTEIIFCALLFVSFPNPIAKCITLGFIMALTWGMGTEHGMALLAAFSLTSILRIITSREARGNIFHFAAIVLAFIVFVLLLHILFGGIEGLKAIPFNIIEVPKDQFWYFGSPPAWAPGYLRELLNDERVYLPFCIGVIFLILVVVLTLKKSKASLLDTEFSTSAITLLAAGVVASVAYLGRGAGDYLVPLIRNMIIILIGWCWLGGLTRKIEKHESDAPTIGCTFQNSFVLPILACILIPYFVWWVPSPFTFERHLTLYKLVSEVYQSGCRLGDGWKNYFASVDSIIGSEKPQGIWCTYSGLLNAKYNLFTADPDYIIHALGPAYRESYLKQFNEKQPEFVETLKRNFFPYEDWIRSTSWEFYHNLLTHYRVAGKTFHSIIWKRVQDPIVIEEEGVSIDINRKYTTSNSNKNEIQIPVDYIDPSTSILILEIEYSVSNRWNRVPVIGNSPRYFAIWSNATNQIPAVCLPPYRKVVRFPLFLKSESKPAISFDARSILLPAGFEVKRLRTSTLKFQKSEDLTDFLE